MNEEEFLQKIKGIKVNVPDEQFFLEYNAVVYNILKENQQLKEQLERSEKARKEAIEYINKHAYFDEEMPSINALGIENIKKVLDILDIDKGEMKDE